MPCPSPGQTSRPRPCWPRRIHCTDSCLVCKEPAASTTMHFCRIHCLSGSREGQHSLRRDTESRWALCGQDSLERLWRPTLRPHGRPRGTICTQLQAAPQRLSELPVFRVSPSSVLFSQGASRPHRAGERPGPAGSWPRAPAERGRGQYLGADFCWGRHRTEFLGGQGRPPGPGGFSHFFLSW